MLRSLSRPLNHPTTRLLSRHGTRMLNGAPRPDWLVIYCRLMTRVLQIDESLRPFLKEQARLHEQHLWHQEVEAALKRVYGVDLFKSKNPDPVTNW